MASGVSSSPSPCALQNLGHDEPHPGEARERAKRTQESETTENAAVAPDPQELNDCAHDHAEVQNVPEIPDVGVLSEEKPERRDLHHTLDDEEADENQIHDLVRCALLMRGWAEGMDEGEWGERWSRWGKGGCGGGYILAQEH